MPSEDTFHKKNPKVNDWMESERTGAKDAPASRTSNQIERLARRTGEDPVKLARKIPADTIRRTQYPVLEQRDEQGRRVFKHDTGIQNDGRIASARK